MPNNEATQPTVSTWAREIMVLPINGQRDDAVRVWSVEGPDGIATHYEASAAWTSGPARTFPTAETAFDWAFATASWNVTMKCRFS